MGNRLRAFGCGDNQSNSHLQRKVHKHTAVDHRRSFGCENIDFGSKVSDNSNIYSSIEINFSIFVFVVSRHFLVLDSAAISVYTYGGRLHLSPKYSGLSAQLNALNEKYISLGLRSIAIRDCSDESCMPFLRVGISLSEFSSEFLFQQLFIFLTWCLEHRDRPNRLSIKQKRLCNKSPSVGVAIKTINIWFSSMEIVIYFAPHWKPMPISRFIK